MIRKLKSGFAALAIFAVLFFVTYSYSEDQGGSVNDPLVTKSYVDELINNLKGSLQSGNTSSASNSSSNKIDEKATMKVAVIETKVSKLESKVDENKARLDKIKGSSVSDDKSGNSSKVSKTELDKIKKDIKENSEKIKSLDKKRKDDDKKEGKSSNEKLEARIKELEKKLGDGKVKNDKDSKFSSAKIFEAIAVENGKKVVLGAGAEIILRSGSATVIEGKNGDGLADLTAGVDLGQGDRVPLQHQLVASRDDGRSVKINSRRTSYLLVKGDYKVE